MLRNLVAVVLMCGLALPAHAGVDVETVRIAHGVRAWYAASETVPVVAVQISIEGAGFASDPSGKEGRAALAAWMLTEGAGPYDAQAFQQALEDAAIDLSIDSSADRLVISVRALREQAERAGELLALALKEPRFAPDDLARVKAQTLTQLKRLNESADYRSGRLMAGHLFAGHPYANPPYGTPESVSSITADDLRAFLATYAARSNVKIAAGGDVDARLLDTMLGPVIEALGENAADPYITPVKLPTSGERLRETMPVPQTVVQFAAPGVARSDKRFYALSILEEALGGNGFVARLARELRQEKGLVYGVGTGIDVRRGVALLTGGFATRNASTEEGIAAVTKVLRDVYERGLTPQECEDARSYVLGSQVLRLDSSEDVAATLLSMQIHRLGTDYLEKREGYLKGVSCTDVNVLARELLDPSRFSFAVVGGTP